MEDIRNRRKRKTFRAQIIGSSTGVSVVLPFRSDCFLLRRESASLYSASVKSRIRSGRCFSGAGRVSLRGGAIFRVGERSEKPQTHTADDATDEGREHGNGDCVAEIFDFAARKIDGRDVKNRFARPVNYGRAQADIRFRAVC